jgi:hypothetical protein
MAHLPSAYILFSEGKITFDCTQYTANYSFQRKVCTTVQTIQQTKYVQFGH